jgi:cold shock CspA family protein
MSATDDNNDKAPVATTTKLTGRVKWFNNKTGFGFITALTDSEGVKEGSDVFVHHSAIKVSQEQYRYLVQGEYVEFVLSKLAADGTDASASKHEFQAVDVSGVKGGKLICETRWESKASGSGSGPGASRFNRTDEASGSGSGPGSGAGSSEWTTVGAPRKSPFVPRQGAGEWRSTRGGRGRDGRGVAAGPATSSA